MGRAFVGFDINVYAFKYEVLFSFSHKTIGRALVGFDINVHVFKYEVLFSFSHKWVELKTQ
jgi:hypothetical protein